MEYENQRLKRIEENKRKMKEMGITANAYDKICSTDQKRRKMNKTKSAEVLAKDVDYIPDEECDIDLLSEEDDNEIMQNYRNLRSQSKKVIASRGKNPAKSFNKATCSTILMSNMAKMQSQAHKNQEQQTIGKNLQKKVLSTVDQQENFKQNRRSSSHVELQQRSCIPISQQEKQVHNNTLTNKGKDKTFVAPGSLGAYMRIKERLGERRPNQIYASQKDSIQLRADLSSGLQVFDKHSGYIDGLVDEDNDLETSDDDIFEEDEAADCNEFENDMAELRNEPVSTEGHLTDQTVTQKQKRKRGPTLCTDVHARINDRKPVIMNELGQPIGPNSSTLDEFSRFLGTLARDFNLAPLNKLDWHHVPNKYKIWDYVKEKYIIAEEGRSYVLKKVGALWRNYKCRIKKDHYKAYDNMRDRLKNCPTSVPKAQFKELLKFWSQKNVQQISERNKEISEDQKDRHTAGPVSFARKRHELERASKVPLSKTALYKETRKRKPEKKYKTSYDLIERNIREEVHTQEHRTLSGMCTKRAKGPSKSGMLIPDEFLQPYRAQIAEETMGQMMKILRQVLPSDMLGRIAPSITDRSDNLVIGQSSNGNNEIDQCQNDGDRDAEADDVNGLERVDEGDDKEMQDEE